METDPAVHETTEAALSAETEISVETTAEILPVKVQFLLEPAGLELTVYTLEDEEKTVLGGEKDQIYTLLPGDYFMMPGIRALKNC